MSGKKGMKKYPVGIREEIVSRIQAGESQRALCREYGISRWAIQCWLKDPALPKTRGRKPAKTPAENDSRQKNAKRRSNRHVGLNERLVCARKRE